MSPVVSSFPGSPRVLKAGFVLLAPPSFSVQQTIPLQINPDSLQRTVTVKAMPEGGDRAEALRLTAPPTETLSFDAEISATDLLEDPDRNDTAARYGIHPQLAALELLAYPTTSQLLNNSALADAGTLEIVPMEAPLAVFVWSPSRVVPVRVTDLSVTEEAFDSRLNPIQAKLHLGLRVLNVNDLGYSDRGGNLYIAYQRTKETLAQMNPSGTLGALGISPGAL